MANFIEQFKKEIEHFQPSAEPALAKKSTPINSATRFYGGVPVASSYFICPLGGACKINQGLHWYNAVDFGGSCGSPVYAAAGGTIQKVKYGWNGGG